MSWYQEHKTAMWFSGGAVAVLIVGGLLFHFLGPGENGNGSKGNKQNKSEATRVKVVYPKAGGIERIVHRPATVQAFDYADLYAKVSGFLMNQKVDIGSRVQKGQLLAEIDAPEKHKDVEKAAADLRKVGANLDAVKARQNRAEADELAAHSRYDQSQAELKRAKALVDLRRKQYRRYQALAAEKAINQELVDEKEEAQLAAEAAEFAAEKGITTAYNEWQSAKATIIQARADVENAKAEIGVARASLDRAKVWADYTRITSPYTGVITVRNYHNGDFIREAAGGGSKPEPILSVSRIDKMRVIVEAPDTAVPYLRVGQQADLTIDTLPDRHFKGKVARMAYRERYETRTMRTEVDFQNPDEMLEDGMYGYMTIHLGREKGLRIPSRCLVGNERGDTRSVYVVRDGKAQEVRVEIGMDDGIAVTIRKGLDPGDQVIADRPSSLGKNMPVEVIPGSDTDAEKEE